MPPSPAPLSSPVNSAHPRRPPPLPPVSRKINGGIREFSMGGGEGKFTERRNSREGETQWTSLTEWRKIPAWTAAVSNVPPFEYRKQSSRISLRGSNYLLLLSIFLRFVLENFQGGQVVHPRNGSSRSDIRDIRGGILEFSLPSKGYLIFSIIIFGKRE